MNARNVADAAAGTSASTKPPAVASGKALMKHLISIELPTTEIRCRLVTSYSADANAPPCPQSTRT